MGAGGTAPAEPARLRSSLRPVVDDALRLVEMDAAVIYVCMSDEPIARWVCDGGILDGQTRRLVRAACLRRDVAGRGASSLRARLARDGSPLRLALAEPIRGAGKVPGGYLCLLGRAGRRVTAHHRTIATLLATQAALAIENAALLRRLDEGEARHRFVLDRLPDVVWAAGADRIFTYLSAGVERLLGYRPDELIGRSSEIVMHESSRATFEEGYRWQIDHPDGEQTYRVNLRHKDGHPVPVELHNIGTPVNGQYGGGNGSVREISETLRLERELQEQAAELAASRERARLAQELHDSITQALFSMTITAGAARLLVERHEPGVEAKLEELSSIAREALAEMRSLIFELRPASVAEAGLVPALRQYLFAVQGRTGLLIEFDVSPDLRELEPQIEDALYRIAQEAVHNVVKHARAREVTVHVANRSNVVRVEIQDDGVGFDARAATRGLGLAGMVARAERLGGSVEVASSQGTGTLVTVALPMIAAVGRRPESLGAPGWPAIPGATGPGGSATTPVRAATSTASRDP